MLFSVQGFMDTFSLARSGVLRRGGFSYALHRKTPQRGAVGLMGHCVRCDIVNLEASASAVLFFGQLPGTLGARLAHDAVKIG